MIKNFKQWRHYFKNAQFTITIIFDHNNLNYFMFITILNKRQIKWFFLKNIILKSNMEKKIQLLSMIRRNVLITKTSWWTTPVYQYCKTNSKISSLLTSTWKMRTILQKSKSYLETNYQKKFHNVWKCRDSNIVSKNNYKNVQKKKLVQWNIEKSFNNNRKFTNDRQKMF